MIRFPKIILAGVILLSGIIRANASVPPSWSHQVEVTPKRVGLTEVTVPIDLLDRAAPTLHDLRIFRRSGEAVPYLLNQPSRSPVRWVPWTSFQSILDNKTTVLSGKGPTGLVDGIRLESPAGEFLKSVALDVYESGDWKNVWKGRPIFRSFPGAGNVDIEFPARRLGQFRIRVDDRENDPIPFTGGDARMAEDAIPLTDKIPVVLSGREEGPMETDITLSLPGQNLYVDGVTIETPNPLFQRSARLVLRQVGREANPGGGQQIIEVPLGQSTLFRAPTENRSVSENIFIPVNRRIPSREIHLKVANGDAPPLDITSVTVHHIPTRLLFFAPDIMALTLVSGHPGAPFPRYDWPKTRALPLSAAVGTVEENSSYVKPEVAPFLATAGAVFDGKGWGYRSSVDIKTPGVQSLEVPLPVLIHGAPKGQDLRLVRDGHQIPFVYDRTGSFRAIDVVLNSVAQAPKGASRWEIKLPMRGIPISHIELRAKESQFQRSLHLYEERSTVNGDRYSRSLAQTTWRRSGGKDRLVLCLAGSPECDRLILDIQDGDNAPLTLEDVKLYYRTYELVFKAGPGATLWLYYGQPEARFPVYDALLVSDELLSAEKTRVLLGAEEKIKNRWSWGTPPQGETSPFFWIVLVAVTLVLLLVIRRLLPDLKGKP